ncbi:MAG: GerMN domain-containing protein [Bacillota bacterium]
MKRLLPILLSIALLLSACAQKPEETLKVQEIDVFYSLKGNTGLGKEIREIEYRNNVELIEKTVEEYFKGPKERNKFEWEYEDTPKLLQVVFEGTDVSLNLSEEFNRFSGAMHEAGVVASIVNTMLQFEEVKRVKLLIEGKEFVAPSGMPYGFMEYIDFSPGGEQREITLYFADSQAMFVVPEKRNINIDKEAAVEELCRKIIEGLIEGPKSQNLHRTIPAEAKILSISVNGDVVSIDFSAEMLTKHSRGAAGEDMTLSSIVNSLTELEGIRGVLLTVEGKPMAIEHVVVTEPLERREDRIYRQ